MDPTPATSLAASQAAAAMTAAVEVVESLPGLVAMLADDEVARLFATLLRVRARAEGAALAALVEAQGRGLIDRSDSANTSAWVSAAAASVDAAVTASEASAFAYVAVQGGSPALSGVLDHAVTGRVGVMQARPILRELACLRHEIPVPAWDAAIDELVAYCAAGAGPRQIAAAREALVARYGEEESFERRHRARRARRDVSGWRLDSAGMFVSTLRLDPESHAVVAATLGALGAPLPGADGGPDDRLPGQRRADALVEMCAHVGTDPTALLDTRPAGAPRTRLILTMSAADYVAGRGHAVTESGDLLPPSVVRRLACDALVTGAALDAAGHVLDVGRAARFATERQVVALRLRDGGCSFPGCERPPSWCDAHHLVEWHLGGRTDLANLALLCRRHHTIVHAKGYAATVTADGVTWHLRPGSAPAPTAADDENDSGMARPEEPVTGAGLTPSDGRAFDPGVARPDESLSGPLAAPLAGTAPTPEPGPRSVSVVSGGKVFDTGTPTDLRGRTATGVTANLTRPPTASPLAAAGPTRPRWPHPARSTPRPGRTVGVVQSPPTGAPVAAADSASRGDVESRHARRSRRRAPLAWA